MEVRYIGSTFGVAGLTNGRAYECLEADGQARMLRIIDDDMDDWNYDDNPDWKPGYLYSAVHPSPSDGSSSGGHWEIIEDDEHGTLNKAIYGL